MLLHDLMAVAHVIGLSFSDTELHFTFHHSISCSMISDVGKTPLYSSIAAEKPSVLGAHVIDASENCRFKSEIT